MALKNEFEVTGNWMFKYRSFLPLFIIPFLFYCTLIPIEIYIQKILLYTGIGISFTGECIRIFTIAYVPSGTSGRNTKQQLASKLNRHGIYSTVRHPLYLGNFFIFLGPFIFTGNIYGIIIFIQEYYFPVGFLVHLDKIIYI